jgi:hypothetical protein
MSSGRPAAIFMRMTSKKLASAATKSARAERPTSDVMSCSSSPAKWLRFYK